MKAGIAARVVFCALCLATAGACWNGKTSWFVCHIPLFLELYLVPRRRTASNFGALPMPEGCRKVNHLFTFVPLQFDAQEMPPLLLEYAIHPSPLDYQLSSSAERLVDVVSTTGSRE